MAAGVGGKAASVCVGGRCGQCLPVCSCVCVCVMEGVFLSSTALRIELLPSRDSFHINSGDFLRVERGPAGSTSEQVILEARGSSCRLVGAGPYQNSDVFCKGTLA